MGMGVGYRLKAKHSSENCRKGRVGDECVEEDGSRE